MTGTGTEPNMDIHKGDVCVCVCVCGVCCVCVCVCISLLCTLLFFSFFTTINADLSIFGASPQIVFSHIAYLCSICCGSHEDNTLLTVQVWSDSTSCCVVLQIINQ